MLQLTAKENLILKACHETRGKIYIYAAGCLGKATADGLLVEHIPVAGFLVDPEYWKKDEYYNGIPILNIEDVALDDDTLVIVALNWYDSEKVARIRQKTRALAMDVTSIYFTIDDLEHGFLEKNLSLLEKTYDMLADDKSRLHMLAWLNQKISGDFKYLENVWEDEQYYDRDIVDFGRIGTFVDCGAYDGDSYRSFLKNYRENTGKEFDGAAYLLEPGIYDECVSKCGNDVRCEVYPIGAWDRRDRLSFSVQGTASVIDQSGGNCIDVDTIDNILGGNRADFIKMDIEGSELNALKGAKDTIIANKPILAICAYHRADDLIVLPEYIRSICADYRFYLRAHSKFTTELVLYAVV